LAFALVEPKSGKANQFLKSVMNSKILLVMLAAGATLPACAPVDPWQRGNLAKPQMALDPYPMLNEMRGHNYSSREAGASGGSGSGGGCGCY
jgi:hypothetical protein